MVPIKPGEDVDGEPIQYSNPKLDPLWEAVADSGIPLCFHIGEAIPTAAPGAAGTFVLTQMQGFRHIWAPADLRRRVRPLPEAAGGVRRGRHLLGGVDAPRRRHDLQLVPHRDEPQAGASAELVLVQPLLRDLHDRPGRAWSCCTASGRPGDVVVRLPAPGIAPSATPAAPSRRCSTPPASRTPRRSSARPRWTCSGCSEPSADRRRRLRAEP